MSLGATSTLSLYIDAPDRPPVVSTYSKDAPTSLPSPQPTPQPPSDATSLLNQLLALNQQLQSSNQALIASNQALIAKVARLEEVVGRMGEEVKTMGSEVRSQQEGYARLHAEYVALRENKTVRFMVP
ncbi:hypothetical protein HDV00_006503 [Rhizophlyctis rosea]|nr:hypothetical protein HDV00_006503 [Rhizophlyctis rosea]